MKGKGLFIISLDFELMWGALDLWTPDGYGSTNISHVDTVIHKLIYLFQKYDVHATFATVGLIMLDGKEEASAFIPQKKPSYKNKILSPFHNSYISGIQDEKLYFSPDLVKYISEQKGIELGSHTFSHYYCWEEGQIIEQFEDDIRMAVRVAKEKGYELKSIVFPRNQVPNDYLDICAKYGFISYRGISPLFSTQPKNKIHGLIQRIGRVLDTYFPLGPVSSIQIKTIVRNNDIINIPSTRFLRPYSGKTCFLERLKIKKIKKEMTYAAKNGEIYHLWWHPHNFGANMDKNLNCLENILQTYKDLESQLGMMSMNMNEAAKYIRDL